MNFQKKGREYEKLVAKEYGSKSNPGSGNHWAAKSDIETSRLLIETKFTSKKLYIFKREEFDKLVFYASRKGKTPVFQIGFMGGKELVLLTVDDYVYLTLEHIAAPTITARGSSSYSINKSIEEITYLQFKDEDQPNIIILPIKEFNKLI